MKARDFVFALFFVVLVFVAGVHIKIVISDTMERINIEESVAKGYRDGYNQGLSNAWLQVVEDIDSGLFVPSLSVVGPHSYIKDSKLIFLGAHDGTVSLNGSYVTIADCDMQIFPPPKSKADAAIDK